MKALELAKALNSGAEFQSEYGRRSAELEFSAPAAASELRRLAEVNAELLEALEAFLVQKPIDEIIQYAEQCKKNAVSVIAKAKEQQ